MCHTAFVQSLTLRCTLKPTPEQAAALADTVRLFAQGCNHALRVAKERGEFRRFRLHRLVYSDLRAMGLSANLAVQAIARVGKKKGAGPSSTSPPPVPSTRAPSRCGRSRFLLRPRREG